MRVISATLRPMVGTALIGPARRESITGINLKPPGLSQVHQRPISFAVMPTTPSARTGPGHIQLVTTPEEQRDFDLSPVYGHSPGPTRRGDMPAISGKLPTGEAFTVHGVHRDAKDFNKDSIRPGAIIVDLGKLTKEEAGRLKELEGAPIIPGFETSGFKGMNCVHGMVKAINIVYKTSVTAEMFETPQGVAEQLKSAIDAARNITR